MIAWISLSLAFSTADLPRERVHAALIADANRTLPRSDRLTPAGLARFVDAVGRPDRQEYSAGSPVPDVWRAAHHFERPPCGDSSADATAAAITFGRAEEDLAWRHLDRGELNSAMVHLGYALHTWQDYFAHSNYPELRARTLGVLVGQELREAERAFDDAIERVLRGDRARGGSLRAGLQAEVLVRRVVLTTFGPPADVRGGCDGLLLRAIELTPADAEYSRTCFGKDLPMASLPARAAARRVVADGYRAAQAGAVDLTARVFRDLRERLPEKWRWLARSEERDVESHPYWEDTPSPVVGVGECE